MTREEAIKIINCYDIGFYDLSGEKIPADKLVDAFDMAIEALSVDVSREDTVTLNSPIIIQAEMVPVVRCKDCKASRVYGKTTQWLACENVMEGQATDPNGYCYLGERKEP